jgi:hypothetical protein
VPLPKIGGKASSGSSWLCDIELGQVRLDALLKAVDETQQRIALPDSAPLALIESVDDPGIFELLEGSAYRDVGLSGEPLSDGDIDHWLLGKNADELPNHSVAARLAEGLEPGGLAMRDGISEALGRRACPAGCLREPDHPTTHGTIPIAGHASTYPSGSAARMRLIGGR